MARNLDFQETAPFRALRSSAPLPDALSDVQRVAKGAPVSDQQMVFWASDLIAITLLDFLFIQQDRIGNVDYVNYWYWLQNGRVEPRRAAGRTTPDDLLARQPSYSNGRNWVTTMPVCGRRT